MFDKQSHSWFSVRTINLLVLDLAKHQKVLDQHHKIWFSVMHTHLVSFRYYNFNHYDNKWSRWDWIIQPTNIRLWFLIQTLIPVNLFRYGSLGVTPIEMIQCIFSMRWYWIFKTSTSLKISFWIFCWIDMSKHPLTSKWIDYAKQNSYIVRYFALFVVVEMVAYIRTSTVCRRAVLHKHKTSVS